MDYEKKYKEALEWARKVIQGKVGFVLDEVLKKFPELKENEDEKVRKDIICYFEHYAHDIEGADLQKWIAWLKKQDNKSVNIDIVSLVNSYEQRLKSQRSVENSTLINMCLTSFKHGVENVLEELNLKQILANSKKTCENEQKSTDKIEPKFHEGEWIACEELNTAKIVNIDDDKYEVEFIDGNKGFPHIDYVDRNFHLWTIQDAKDGDVLVEDSCIFIIQKLGDNSTAAKTYFTLYNDGDFDDGSILYFDIDSTKPATKEQRDTLMKAMDDAGYTFDFEKKELKKIEQNPAEEYNIAGIGSKNAQGKLGQMIKKLKPVNEVLEQKPCNEEDERMIDTIIADLGRHGGKEDSCYLAEINWLKSLKDMVGCEANRTTTKEWSEDEESIINKAESWLDTLCDYLKDSSPEYISDIKDVINKLKSIKDRYTWKPSSIQMECLHDAIEHYHTNGYPATKLTELYEQMSKIYKL